VNTSIGLGNYVFIFTAFLLNNIIWPFYCLPSQ